MGEVGSAECMVAIVRGEVQAAAVIRGYASYEKTLAEWSADSRVTEISRVPTEVARMFLFKRWPGREAAIAEAMASVAAPPTT